MTNSKNPTSRRGFLAAVASSSLVAGARSAEQARDGDRALVAITLDLEMSRHYPTWDETHWDYEKGNLDRDTKRYTLEAARRVRLKGGRIHAFAVGQTLEQENIEWLRELASEGHAIGNHTYDHVNVLATKPEDVQFRFRRAPWLIEGKTPAAVIEENIRLTSRALKQRAGIEAAGFRTPGGFPNGLSDRPDLQEMLLKLGYRWVSSKYPAYKISGPGQTPGPEDFRALVAAQERAQPFVYPSGLVEVPMSPISDISALRSRRWPLDPFLEALAGGVAWAIANRACFDFLAHPSCLVVADPEFRAIDLICDLVQAAGDRATLTDLGTLAARARAAKS